MTPSLQNPYMLAHPPLLYLGYVGPDGPVRVRDRRAPLRRSSTSAGSSRPGAGRSSPGRPSGSASSSGSHWAYVEVGWGGYYAWDPVENAALMPWLAATAFLHSVMIQEKRGMLKVWNVLLVILAFSLVALRHVPHPLRRRQLDPLVHAELDRAVVPRVHRRSSSLSRSALVFWRLPQLRSPTKLESPISREAAFLYNNLLLLALCLAILWGVVYPMLSEAVRGEAVVLGRSYYDFFLRAFGLPLLLLMGIGPLIAWRRASLREPRDDVPLADARRPRHGRGCSLLLGAGSSIPGLVAYTFSAFVIATIVMEFARGTRARKALGAGSWPSALSAR